MSAVTAAPAGLLVPCGGSTSISGSAAGASSDRGSGAVSAIAAAIAGGSWVSGAGPDGVGRLRSKQYQRYKIMPPALHACVCWHPMPVRTAECLLAMTNAHTLRLKRPAVLLCNCRSCRALRSCRRLTSPAAGLWFRPRRGRRRLVPAPPGPHQRLPPAHRPAMGS